MRAATGLLAGLFAATAFFVGPAAPAGVSSCRAALVYNSVTYYALEASHLGLRPGPAAGVAREPVCRPSKVRYRRVAVRSILGVRPRVAIARRDVPHVIYIAADRCRKISDARALVRCLRRSR